MKAGWDSRTSQHPEHGYPTLTDEVRLLAEEAAEDTEELQRVANALGCHLTLGPDPWKSDGDHYCHYGPAVRMSSGRTTQEEIPSEWRDCLLDAQQGARNPWIVGRLGDLVWRSTRRLGQTRSRNMKPYVDAARKAIDAWLSVWDAGQPDGLGAICALMDAWPRMASLAGEAGTKDQKRTVRERMFALLRQGAEEARTEGVPYLVVSAAEAALRRCKADKEGREEVAHTLATMAREMAAHAEKNERCRQWLKGIRERTATWAEKTGDHGLKAEMLWALGKERITKAEALHGAASGKETPWVLAMEYAEGIKLMEQGRRAEPGREAELEEIRRKHHEYMGRSHEGLTPIEVPVPELEKVAAEAEASVEGRSYNEAMAVLAMVYHKPQGAEWYKVEAEKAQSQGILAKMVHRVHLAPSGQQVHHEEHEKKRSWAMGETALEHFNHVTALTTQVLILPRIRKIREEHGDESKKAWYRELCEQSAWVPANHVAAWARGLECGMREEWTESMHWLLPRFEACLRGLADKAGILRLKRHDGAIEPHWLLMDLLDPERSAQLISEEWRSEIEAAVASPTNWNLRNNHCHGMMGDDDYDRIPSVYTWWLALHMTVSAARPDSTLPLKTPHP